MRRGSFEAINYALRPNKNVERKLIATTLFELREKFTIRDYRYVGFGSMWFSDFVLMHKMLGIHDMVTIENQISRKKRVEFNKPFACIIVRMEQASSALGNALSRDKRSIVWLDYDGPLKDALTGDLETAVGVMASGSIILVSVNATVDQLRGHVRDDEQLSPAEYLSEVCDDESLKHDSARLTRNDFPNLVCDRLHARLKSAVLDFNPTCEYVPIWTFRYEDGAIMATVGGMIANVADRKTLNDCKLDELAFTSPSTPFEIRLPTLTDKEKRALDKLLPNGKPLNYQTLEFELRATEVSAYEQFYLHYPVFNEIVS